MSNEELIQEQRKLINEMGGLLIEVNNFTDYPDVELWLQKRAELIKKSIDLYQSENG